MTKLPRKHIKWTKDWRLLYRGDEGRKKTLTDKKAALEAWQEFVFNENHILRRYPALIFQQAANQPDGSVPARFAQNRLTQGLPTRPWFRKINKSPQISPLHMTLTGHEGPVLSCSFSPDGQQVASASEDGTVRLWLVQTGQEKFVFRRHEAKVLCCAWSSLGDRVISGSEDGVVKVWDSQSGQEILSLTELKSAVTACSFSPKGNRAIIGYRDGSMQIWEMNGRGTVETLGKQAGEVNVCLFSPDESRIVWASGGRNTQGEFAIWDTATRKSLATEIYHYGIRTCFFSPDGSWVIAPTKYYKSLTVWDCTTGQRVKNLAEKMYGIWKAIGSADGLRMLFIIRNIKGKSLSLWDWKTNKETASFSGITSRTTDVCFSPDGEYFLLSSHEGVIHIVSVSAIIQAAETSVHTDRLRGCAFVPEKKTLITVGRDDTIAFWKSDNGKIIDKLTLPPKPWLPQHIREQLWLRCSQPGDFEQAVVDWIYEHPDWGMVGDERVSRMEAVAASPDGHEFATAGIRMLAFWLMDHSEPIATLREQFNTLDWSTDGRSIITDSGLVRIGNDGKFSQMPLAQRVSCSRFLPDTRRIVCVADKFGIINPGSMGEAYSADFPRETEGSWGCAIAPDGRTIAIAGLGAPYYLWSVSSKAFRPLPGPPADTGFLLEAPSLSFSADGKLLLGVSRDMTATLWSVSKGDVVASYCGFSSFDSLSTGWHPFQFALGDRGGNLHLLRLMGAKPGAAIATAVYLFRLDRGEWDDYLTALCFWCGQRERVQSSTIETIRAIEKNAKLSESQSPCLELPDEAWQDPGLAAECPRCHGLLRFNPFLVDNRAGP